MSRRDDGDERRSRRDPLRRFPVKLEKSPASQRQLQDHARWIVMPEPPHAVVVVAGRVGSRFDVAVIRPKGRPPRWPLDGRPRRLDQPPQMRQPLWWWLRPRRAAGNDIGVDDLPRPAAPA